MSRYLDQLLSRQGKNHKPSVDDANGEQQYDQRQERLLILTVAQMGSDRAELSPTAASGVSHGKTSVIIGITSPTAPSTSSNPMSLVVLGENVSAHTAPATSFFRGVSIIIVPVNKNNSASSPCTLQSSTFVVMFLVAAASKPKRAAPLARAE